MQEPKRACPFWCSQSAVRCSLIADRCYQSIFQLYSLFAILSIFIHNSPTSKGLLRTVFCIAARDCKPAADSLPAKARPPPPTSPAGVNARPAMQGKREVEPGTAGPPAPGQRGDPCVGLPSGLTCGYRFCITARPRAQCRAGDFARREPSTAVKFPGNPERYWQGKAPHPSVGWRRQLPLQGSLSNGSLPKASSARGCGCAASPPAGVNDRPTIHGKREAEPGTAGPRARRRAAGQAGLPGAAGSSTP